MFDRPHFFLRNSSFAGRLCWEDANNIRQVPLRVGSQSQKGKGKRSVCDEESYPFLKTKQNLHLLSCLMLSIATQMRKGMGLFEEIHLGINVNMFSPCKSYRELQLQSTSILSDFFLSAPLKKTSKTWLRIRVTFLTLR